MVMYICKFCQRHSPSKSGRGRHQKHCQLNPDRVPNNLPKRPIGYKHSEETKKKISLNTPGIASTYEAEKERKEKIRQYAIKNKLGGYVKGSGRGKKGWYKGFFCDSSWELAYIIYNLDHGISIERNTEKRSYKFNGKIKTYIPDFIVEKKIIEIKGYKTDEWMAKLAYNPDVKVLYEKDLTEILSYTINKYGKDFIRLYE